MSRAKGPRLWLRPARTEDGSTRQAVYIIRDGSKQRSTGFGVAQLEEATEALGRYIAESYSPNRVNNRSPSEIEINDVLMIYVRDIAPKHARPHETAMRVEALSRFFGGKRLSYVTGATCRAYAASRSTTAAARRELEDFRSAIRYHRREGLCSEIVEVVLPERSQPRERWLTRSDAARLLLAAWRRSPHVARFILVGLYTGTRAGAICGASLRHVSGRGFIDLERGILYRRAAGAKETKKRQPPAPIPPRLLCHMRRWARLGLCDTAIVEWNGRPVGRVSKAFRMAARAAGLQGVSPHTLRHTAATWLMESGCDVKAAADYLGMTPEMVVNRYGHVGPNAHRRAIEAISAWK